MNTLLKQTAAGVVFAALLVAGLLLWARGRDPFTRHWFSIAVPNSPRVQAVAVLPKAAPQPLPVVIYFHGSQGDIIQSGNRLRVIAELGIAAVDMNYSQTNETIFDQQFTALLDHVRRQSWADTNKMAWIGHSLGAQTQLSYALRHPEQAPPHLIRLGGGLLPELDPTVPARNGNTRVETNRPGSVSALKSRVLLIHGGQEEVFPVAQVEKLAGILRSNGVPVELQVFQNEGHVLTDSIYRHVAEYCLSKLNGEDAFSQYHSITAWQERALPLWLWLFPAALWAGTWGCIRWKQRGSLTTAPAVSRDRSRGLVWLRVAAIVLALIAVAQTALHLLLPRLEATPQTLNLVRKFLIPESERSDFDYLARSPVWKGKKLGTLIQHVHLANYNRQIVNWKIDDSLYREYVLAAEIHAEADGSLHWRRMLWESCYPRIRKEGLPENASVAIVRHLRSRVTVSEGAGHPVQISEIWTRQLTTPAGFASLNVAALRACGIPARLSALETPELWNGTSWTNAPQALSLAP